MFNKIFIYFLFFILLYNETGFYCVIWFVFIFFTKLCTEKVNKCGVALIAMLITLLLIKSYSTKVLILVKRDKKV